VRISEDGTLLKGPTMVGSSKQTVSRETQQSKRLFAAETVKVPRAIQGHPAVDVL
jgi:hypothetical protein